MNNRLLLGVDFETRLFGPGNMAPKPICATRSMRGQEDEIVVGDFLPVWFAKLLDLSSYDAEVCRLAFHNAAYDLGCFVANYPEHAETVFRALEGGGVHCTMIREQLLDIARGPMVESYSLNAVVARRYNLELEKDEFRTRFEEFENLPLDEWPKGAIEYAKTDAEFARRIHNEQTEDAKELRYVAFDEESTRQTAFDFALRSLLSRGVTLDAERVERELRKYENLENGYIASLRSNNVFHPGTTKRNMTAIQKLVEKSYPGDPPRTEKTNKIKTDAETIADCSHPALVTYSNFQTVSKLLSTYLRPMYERGSGPIHAGFVTLMKSGRTSCRAPNLQNLPRVGGVRECVVPREGFVFATADYDSQEIRTLGQVCKTLLGRSTIADRYSDDPDFDPHSDFAAKIHGIKYAEGLKRKAAGDEEFAETRQRAKAANFGFPVGMAPKTFVRKCHVDGIELTLDEAEHLRAEWLKQWPEMSAYFRAVKDMIRTSGGRVEQLVSGRVRGGCEFTVAANTLFQGLAAESSKNALYEVVKATMLGTGDLAGSFPVLFVHDEIIIEAPVATASEAAEELAQVMVAAMTEVCPDVPSRASATLMTRWSKKAEPIFDREGRLLPWKEN